MLLTDSGGSCHFAVTPWWLRYSLIGALLVPYIRDLPSTQSFNVFGVMVSPKWFTYLLALQVCTWRSEGPMALS